MCPMKFLIRLFKCAGYAEVRWVHMSEDTFSNVVALIIIYFLGKKVEMRT